MEPQAESWPEPVGRPDRPRWWSIQPPSPAARSRPVSAGRAYGEVLLVFTLFFAASTLAGGETLARRYPVPSGSWAVFLPATINQLASCVLALLVTMLLSARRGIRPRDLGFGWPPRPDGRPAVAQSLRLVVWALVALQVGGAITAALAMGNKLGQPAHQDASYVVYTVAASLAAGIVEETVVLAFVVTTLRQAGRPLPEILAVAVLLRCSYHDYYGLGVLGVALWAAVFVWLYLRSGSVLPLIIAHVLWDASIFLSQHWHGLRPVSALGFILLLLVAVITWLVDVSRRHAAPPGGAPGGWARAGGTPGR